MMMGDEQARESPRDFETLRAMIVERRDVLPKRLAQVAVYALDNPDEIAFGTAASVAGSAAVQPSTLVRFAQAFGYQGFSELQEVFRSRLRERVPSYDERLARMRQHGIPTSKSSLVLDGFLEAAQRSVAELREKIKPDLLERALAALPREQREAVTLKIDGELTFEEVAAILGISPNTAARA